jgi:hypothetical protein
MQARRLIKNARMKEMKLGDRVILRLHGEPDYFWYKGTVIDPGREWVQLDNYPAGDFIADENNICEWHPIADL